MIPSSPDSAYDPRYAVHAESPGSLLRRGRNEGGGSSGGGGSAGGGSGGDDVCGGGSGSGSGVGARSSGQVVLSGTGLDAHASEADTSSSPQASSMLDALVWEAVRADEAT